MSFNKIKAFFDKVNADPALTQKFKDVCSSDLR